MTLGRAPYTPTYLQIKKHKLSILQAILLTFWQIIGNMYIEKSCNFHNFSSRHLRVIEKLYDLLGQPS